MESKLNLLVIGNGGREFAICRKLKQSPLVDKVYCAPGNAGMDTIDVHQVAINEDEFAQLAEFVRQQKIDLTFVGPEDALASGIVNYFRRHNLKIVGPTREAAQLESSKDFALNFMVKYHVPTAQYQTFTAKADAEDALGTWDFPLVIKENGLAGGKGVFIVETREQAESILGSLAISIADPVIFEEFLEGPEYSFFVLLNQNSYQIFPVAQDHKKALDGDLGLNTGGMGAYSPVPQFSADEYQSVVSEVIESTMTGIHEEKFDYRGILYVGIMMTSQGPKVIEYNVRLGDPETQVVLPRIENDFCKLLLECEANQKIDPIQISQQAYVNVVLAAKGYPEKYQKGQEMPIFDTANLGMIDYANVTFGKFLLKGNGGRILSVIGIGKDVALAQQNAYRILENHPVSETYYRRDIAYRAIRK